MCACVSVCLCLCLSVSVCLSVYMREDGCVVREDLCFIILVLLIVNTKEINKILKIFGIIFKQPLHNYSFSISIQYDKEGVVDPLLITSLMRRDRGGTIQTLVRYVCMYVRTYNGIFTLKGTI